MVKPGILCSIFAVTIGMSLPVMLSSQAKPFEPDLSKIVGGAEGKLLIVQLPFLIKTANLRSGSMNAAAMV